MAKSSQRDWLNLVSNVPGTWRNVEGGGATAEYNRDYDGGSDKADFLVGPTEHEDLTFTRTFDPVRDAAWIKKLEQHVGRSKHRLSRQPIDANKTAVGKPKTYYNALLVGLTYPGSAPSADPSEIVLVFAHNGPSK
ncbi:hypothetical protein [Zhihengliuella halotolerans]|uniref:hypothetical protein n=1 Tax=Zhihengliuella halotolerans TaxID=370736 RepID=UPI000C8085A2|nr:hypothetical protein [Zhihengliuella halotolerans]